MKTMRDLFGLLLVTLILLFGAGGALLWRGLRRLPYASGGDGWTYGAASYYGEAFRGRITASGDRFDPSELTCACNIVPLGTLLAVVREDGRKWVTVRVNDRMPISTTAKGRIVDLSQRAFLQLAKEGDGLVRVRIRPSVR